LDFLVSKSSSTKINFQKETVTLVETNVDDVTGEVVARTVERLLEEGAYDATAVNYLGKKGRTGQTIRAVCEKGSAEKFGQILVEETGSLGIKTTDWTRMIVPRRTVLISVSIGKFKGQLKAKVARTGTSLRIKPELEDAKKISDSEKIPLREVLELISKQAISQIGDS
jgi:pyridinium-3,5-bisthiocarboxylic acid mononucleotide nickel chelatase